MDDYFPTMNLAPSSTCPNFKCIELQEKYKDWDVSEVMPWKAEEAAAAALSAPVHEDNEWNITCDDDEPTIDFGVEPASGGTELGTGVKVAFERSHELGVEVAEEDLVQPEGSV